jgi:hypothetical protein
VLFEGPVEYKVNDFVFKWIVNQLERRLVDKLLVKVLKVISLVLKVYELKLGKGEVLVDDRVKNSRLVLNTSLAA